MEQTIPPDPPRGPVTDDQIREAVKRHGQYSAAARELGVPIRHLRPRAIGLGLKGKWSAGSAGLFDTPKIVALNALRDAVFAKYGNRCAHCGFRDRRALQIDHVHNDRSKDRTKPRDEYLRRVLADTTGRYQVLCANCNTIKEHDRREGVSWLRPGFCRCGKKLRWGKVKRHSGTCSRCHFLMQADHVRRMMCEEGLSASEAARRMGLNDATTVVIAQRLGINRRRGREVNLMVSFGAFLHEQGATIREAVDVTGASFSAIYARTRKAPVGSKSAP